MQRCLNANARMIKDCNNWWLGFLMVVRVFGVNVFGVARFVEHPSCSPLRCESYTG